MLYKLGTESPRTAGDDYFVAPTAVVIGRVTLGHDANVWFGAVLRGDVNTIEVGDGTNVQENSVIHVDGDAPARIGANVTIGHSAVVHGCTIGDYSLVGIGATILSHAKIGQFCLVGAGALITERKEFPDRSLIIGAPAKRIREVTDAEVAMLRESAAHYAERGRHYRSDLILVSDT
jgi:carbonic anhydrase/acetyltransferase-like protein (isoleucine patch superfamily)